MWRITIGLEIHAQIKSCSKLFSPASTKFAAAPNSQVSRLDAAIPGALPVLNRFCVEQAIRTSLALGCKVQTASMFERKHYFYADLPLGYQITQQVRPIALDGLVSLDIAGRDEPCNVRIQRVQLEQDSGKSIHDAHPDWSLIDLNRAGQGLMEIVTAPDMHSSIEAGEFIRKLQALLRHIDSCDGNMEEGSLRCDVNVSVTGPNQPKGVRCEIKNLNSIRNVMKSIEVEAQRQRKCLEEGVALIGETRQFDAVQGITRAMRTKETAWDYRFMPDPDLPILRIDPREIDRIRLAMPPLLDEIKTKLINDYKLSATDAQLLMNEPGGVAFFQRVVSDTNNNNKIVRNPEMAKNWICNELLGHLHKKNKTLENSSVTSDQIISLIDALNENQISSRHGKDILEIMAVGGSPKNAREIAKENNFVMINDDSMIIQVVTDLIKENPQQIADIKAGKHRLIGFFVGETMKKCKGKADPKRVDALVREYIAKQ